MKTCALVCKIQCHLPTDKAEYTDDETEFIVLLPFLFHLSSKLQTKTFVQPRWDPNSQRVRPHLTGMKCSVQYYSAFSHYCGGCAILWSMFSNVRDIIRTVGWISSVLWRDTISTVKGYHQYCGGYSVQSDIISTLWGDSIMRWYRQYCEALCTMEMVPNVLGVSCTVLMMSSQY